MAFTFLGKSTKGKYLKHWKVIFFFYYKIYIEILCMPNISNCTDYLPLFTSEFNVATWSIKKTPKTATGTVKKEERPGVWVVGVRRKTGQVSPSPFTFTFSGFYHSSISPVSFNLQTQADASGSGGKSHNGKFFSFFFSSPSWLPPVPSLSSIIFYTFFFLCLPTFLRSLLYSSLLSHMTHHSYIISHFNSILIYLFFLSHGHVMDSGSHCLCNPQDSLCLHPFCLPLLHLRSKKILSTLRPQYFRDQI